MSRAVWAAAHVGVLCQAVAVASGPGFDDVWVGAQSPWPYTPTRSPPALRSLPPLPPGQSPYQQRLTSAVAAKAARLSSAATPQLLALLGSSAVTTALRRCCGHWADAPPETLLAAVRDYVRSVEVVHNFEAKAASDQTPATARLKRAHPPEGANGFVVGLGGSGATCVDLQLAASSPYLPNLWMVE